MNVIYLSIYLSQSIAYLFSFLSIYALTVGGLGITDCIPFGG